MRPAAGSGAVSARDRTRRLHAVAVRAVRPVRAVPKPRCTHRACLRLVARSAQFVDREGIAMDTAFKMFALTCVVLSFKMGAVGVIQARARTKSGLFTNPEDARTFGKAAAVAEEGQM